MKVLFLIRSMDYGGAERQLALLARGLRLRGHEVVVSVFYAGGPLEQELRDASIRIVSLHKQGRWDILPFLWRLLRVVREEQPDILHGYLSEPNLVALVLKSLCPSIRVVWGVRASFLDFGQYDWIDRFSFRLNCWLARFADAIIVNSQVGREYHVAKGFPAQTTVCIPNGIDTERFQPDGLKRRLFRSKWGVREDERLVGLVGRLDPMKDHPIFLEAAALLMGKRDKLRFVCVGDGPEDYRSKLQLLTRTLGLKDRIQWIDAQADMPAIYNALDIMVSSSCGEGLSNVIGEAMACGVPCVVTDVGDSAWVVGDQGEVIPPKSPNALVEAIEKVLDEHKCDPARIRQRVVDQLSVNSLVTGTERVLKAMLRDLISGAFGRTRTRSVH